MLGDAVRWIACHLRVSPVVSVFTVDGTDISCIEQTVSMWRTGGRKRITHNYRSRRQGFHVDRAVHVVSNFADLEATALRLRWFRSRSH